VILITGGCGYIGSHVNKQLNLAGWDTLVLDNLSTGHEDVARWGHFVPVDLCDAEEVLAVFEKWPIEAVIHFAAFSQVGESVRDPQKYYRNNIGGSLNLACAMQASGVKKIVFSSSGAVYGMPLESPIPETHPTKPINPYGYTKLFFEHLLASYHAAYGMDYIALRYFNAAGADADGELGEWHDPETHLIPRLLMSARMDQAVHIYGDAHRTPDGTCVRDYIHVDDLAYAHVLALERVLNSSCATVYNLSTGLGHSVRDVIKEVEEATQRQLSLVYSERRPGDPPVLVGDSAKARKELGWRTRYVLRDMIDTAWRVINM